MQKTISHILLLGLGMVSLTTPLIAQTSSQAQVSPSQSIVQLYRQGEQQVKKQEYQQAIQIFQQVLLIARKEQNRELEAYTLLGLGFSYDKIGEKKLALDFYEQAFSLFQLFRNPSGEAATLNNIGGVYSSLGEKQKAKEYYNQALPLYRTIGDKQGEATTLNGLGRIYDDLGEKQKATEYYNQALSLRRTEGDKQGEATTLNNIGAVYSSLGEKQKALEYYGQALSLYRSLGDRSGEATALNNVGAVYDFLGEKQKALEYYNQALPLHRAVGDQEGEAKILGNIGVIYREQKQLTTAISKFQESAKIFLRLRQGLLREQRQKFLQQYDWAGNLLVETLIDNKQAEQAFIWANLFTTAELTDYARLINARVANPEAQAALDQWNQQNQILQAQRQNLQQKFDENLAQQIRASEAKILKEGENIARRFPEVAELVETTPQEIEKLKADIPAGTVVVQPILLKDNLAIFVVTQNQVSVVKQKIDGNFKVNLDKYLKQIQNESDSVYIESGGVPLYDLLIRPVENQIQAAKPKQLSVIPSGKLRYLPFETLYDNKTGKFMIEKYPINYITRISTRYLKSPFNQNTNEKPPAVLAFGNPVPLPPQNLPGAEEEVKSIKQILPDSEYYIGKDATVANFKTQALRFPFLHLATHGCFQSKECEKIGLKPNTLLFADTQFDISQAASLGFQGTRLLTLSACQTAQATSLEGESLAGAAYIFERAGAQAVMASLWTVDDAATRELMEEFYRNIKLGKTKGEALQAAKLKLINEGKYSHPYYWSAFILIGDAE